MPAAEGPRGSSFILEPMARCSTMGALRRLLVVSPAALVLPSVLPLASGQMFEIPAEMLQGMMGGGMMGGGRRQEMTEWPKTENSEVEKDMEWLINTEWQGKTAKYLLLRDGIIESSLKECDPEGMCLWAANNGMVLMNTPTLKVLRFDIHGLASADRKKLENKDEQELKKIQLIAQKASKSGKRSKLDFARLAVGDEDEATISRDLYEILGATETDEVSAIKSKFRRLSVQHHPDKGGDPKLFNEMREAFEIIGDKEKRIYYDQGGVQLVKNIETAWKEVEGQKAQLDLQLQKVPKNHPQYNQFKAQVEQQKKQFEPSRMKHDIEKKMRSDDLEVMVPISAEELYNGVASKSFTFQRLVICRGCRADPDSPKCKDCGRCPPEKLQVPQYARTPFGRQVVGVKEKEQESRERCREVPVSIEGLRVPAGAKEGKELKHISEIGHQTPGKMPGRVVLKVQRGSPTDTYTIAEADLHTVLHVSMEQALFGFTATFKHLGSESLTITKDRVIPGEVVKFRNKGLVSSKSRGDLFVRLVVDMPEVPVGSTSISFAAPAASDSWRFEREESVELREGSAWRLWPERAAAKSGSKRKQDKEEL